MARKIPVVDNWATTYVDNDPYKAPEQRHPAIALRGNVTGHPGFSAGHFIVTSAIENVKRDRYGFVVYTKSGSRYRLGTIDPKWIDWMEENGFRFDPDDPIRDLRP